jgi:hypothetical protein
VIGALSKIVASFSTYPLQVVKTRLQDQQNMYHAVKYTGMLNAFTNIYKNEGFASFYRGMVANIARVTPGAAVTLVFYEQIMNFFNMIEE